jgi:uncharacterized protein (TIGR00725 family)
MQSMALTTVGVMGPGAGATAKDLATAHRLGQLIARAGWVTLTGGRASGVMQAALSGAKQAGGLTVGVLPGDTAMDAAEAADIRIVTGMREARNVVNILSSQVVFVCGMSAGTASEVALALKTRRPVVFVDSEPEVLRFWAPIGEHLVHATSTVEEAIDVARRLLATLPDG